MVACRWVTLSMVGLLCAACGDDGGGDQGQPDASDAGNDTSAPDTTDDSADVLQTGDGWIDGSYLDGREGPPPEHCTDGTDNDGDGQSDCDDDECSPRLVCGDGLTAETEPNNRAQDGPLLSLPLELAGGIGEYTENEDGNAIEDSDWVRFTIGAPMLVEWELDDANGAAIPILTLVGAEEATGGVIRQLDSDTPGSIRQAYLPVAGTYAIEVRDRRNTSRDGDEFPYGGAGYEYAFRLEEVDLVFEAETLPFESGPAQLAAGNELPILALSLLAGEVFEAQVRAQRLAPSSGLDAMLYLVASNGQVLAFNDDPPISTRDPLLRTGILAEAVEALLVVDAFRVDFDGNYELTAEMLEPSQDREPNDPIGLAFPGEVGAAISGQIGAPYLRGSGTVRDADYYYFPGGTAAAYTVTVTAEGDLNAAVRTGYRFIDSRGRDAFGEIFQADPPDDAGVTVEATSLVDAPFYVEVTDRTNLFDREADPVGGDDFDYELTVVAHTREFTLLTLPAASTGELTGLGETDWFELTAPARTRLEIGAVEQSEGVEPFVYLALPNDVLVQRGSRGFSYLNVLEQAFRVGVVDRRAGGGDAYDYDFDVIAHAHTVIAESEPNDGPPVGGQSVEVLPGWVDGVIAPSDGAEDLDRDIYVVSLEAGEYLIAETTFGPNLELDDADTVIDITGPGLAAAIHDDDGGYGWFARAAFEAPQDGVYEIAVTPWCNDDGCRSGDYGIAFWIGEAPPEE